MIPLISNSPINTLCRVFFLLGAMQFAHSQDAGSPPASQSVTEMFRISKVGRPNAAEKRETLMAIFQEVSKQYNAEIQASQNSQIFKGDRVRVIRKLQQKADDGSTLHLVAYGGGPSVMTISGEGDLLPGMLTPPLIISEAEGEHTSEITRRVKVPNPKSRGPELEVVSDDEVPTFFGIPITGVSGSKNKSSEDSEIWKTVTETKTFKKYSASISTEKTDNRPTEMTKDIFLNRLKNGEVFRVTQVEKRKCRRCGGYRRILGVAGDRAQDGKRSCPDCQEAGKIAWTVTYQVTW